MQQFGCQSGLLDGKYLAVTFPRLSSSPLLAHTHAGTYLISWLLKIQYLRRFKELRFLWWEWYKWEYASSTGKHAPPPKKKPPAQVWPWRSPVPLSVCRHTWKRAFITTSLSFMHSISVLDQSHEPARTSFPGCVKQCVRVFSCLCRSACKDKARMLYGPKWWTNRYFL